MTSADNLCKQFGPRSFGPDPDSAAPDLNPKRLTHWATDRVPDFLLTQEVRVFFYKSLPTW